MSCSKRIKLDDIGKRLEHAPQKSLKRLSFQLCTRYISQIQIRDCDFLTGVRKGKLWITGCKTNFFSDEAWFYLHGQVCSQNYRYYSD